MEETQYRYMTIPIAVVNSTVVNSLKEANIQLDRDYDKITGIAYVEITAGGLSNNYQVGARSSRRTWVDPVNIQSWQAGNGVEPDRKFRKVEIPYASGDPFYVQVNLSGGPTTSDLTGEMILRLEKTLTELPK